MGASPTLLVVTPTARISSSDPAVAGGDGIDMGLGQHGDGGEVEGLQRFAGQQACLCEMALDPAAIAFGQFMLYQSGKQAGGRPALLVGLFSKAWPEGLDGRQAQFVQSKGKTGGIGLGRCHAATSSASAALLTS
jgi:hypothetical protein